MSATHISADARLTGLVNGAAWPDPKKMSDHVAVLCMTDCQPIQPCPLAVTGRVAIEVNGFRIVGDVRHLTWPTADDPRFGLALQGCVHNNQACPVEAGEEATVTFRIMDEVAPINERNA